MKTILKVLICFMILSGPGVCAVNLDGDIIYNGDFNDDLTYWFLGGVNTYCTYNLVPGEEYNTLQIDIFSEPEVFWNVQLTQGYKTAVNKNDILLLSFNLKNPDNSLVVAVQDNGSPWAKYVWVDIPVSDITRKISIAFNGSVHNWNADEVELCFFFGEKTGTFEISNISYKNLGSDVDINALNADIIYHPFFGTQNNTDDWRQPALERIENIRKSPLMIKCVDRHGNPLENVEISIQQTKKYFPFGTAVAADLFGGEEFNYIYVEKVEELFNMVTIKNHLKWKMIDRAHPAVDYVFDWAEPRDIPVHGHCLFWPSYEHCPGWVQGLSTEELYHSVIAHVENYTQEYKGKVVHWDVLNEAVTSDEIWQECGIELLRDCYIVAKENDPDVLLMYNDFNLLVNDPEKQDQVISLINDLRNMGAPIEGLGIQGHLKLPCLVTPENALKNLDKMATLDLPIFITEFDICTEGNWEFQGEYFRDLMTALYSHPSVEGIIQWGFWEGDHWRPDAALYNYDWTPRPAGVEFENLMFQEWETHTTQYTNQSGVISENCFHGDYEIVARFGNCTITDTITVLPGENASLLLVINTDNHPPAKPEKPDGPTSGKPRIQYTYLTTALDPDGDHLFIKWDFGDGEITEWLGPYDSGETVMINHTWNKKGSYEIKVKTKDEYNAESSWSDPLLVTIAKNKESNFLLSILSKLIHRLLMF